MMEVLNIRKMVAVVALCTLTWLSASASAMTETADMTPGHDVGVKDKLVDTYAEAINFHYTHLWASKNGTTHFAECHMKGFKSQVYAEGIPPLMVRPAILPPKMLNYIKLPPNKVLGAHNCPAPQFVAVMKGSWWVQASDGQRQNFSSGEVMFQDATADNPADRSPKHSSGTNNDLCNQMAVQVDWDPEFGKPCPF